MKDQKIIPQSHKIFTISKMKKGTNSIANNENK